jgi:hypothetical protein
MRRRVRREPGDDKQKGGLGLAGPGQFVMPRKQADPYGTPMEPAWRPYGIPMEQHARNTEATGLQHPGIAPMGSLMSGAKERVLHLDRGKRCVTIPALNYA